MKISKEDYIEKVRDNLDSITEVVAGDLFVLGSCQDFIDDNDIFEAIHAYLGSIEVPVSDAEHRETVNAIRKLLEDYDKKKTAKRPSHNDT